jgi:hypothetical protein
MVRNGSTVLIGTPAAFCRSLKPLVSAIFVQTRRIGAYRVEPILSAGAPTSILIGAFSLTSAMKERAVDDPFRQTRDPRIRADWYQRLARQYFDLAKDVSSPSLRADY